MKNTIIVKLPDGVLTELDSCLKEHPPTFTYDRDNFIYFLGKIFYIPQYNPDLKGMRLVPIYSKIVREELGRNYKKYIEYLLNWEFLVTDNYYIPAKLNPEGWGKCKCYGFTAKFAGKSVVKCPIKKRSLLKRMEIWNRKTIENVKSDPILTQIKEFLDKITFDYDGAIRKLDELFKNKKISLVEYDIEMDRCERIKNKDFYIVRDEAGRIHTNLTNISKEIREDYLFIDGEKATGLDIRSCQPALLYALLIDYFEKIKKNHSNKFEVSQNSISKSMVDTRKKYSSYENQILEELPNFELPMDVSMFEYRNFELLEHDFTKEINTLRDVLKSDIYGNIQNWWKSYFGVTLKTRKQAKKFFFSYIFGRNSMKRTRMRQVWETEFPLLNRMISFIKEPNYKFLAHKLQKKESEIVIDSLCSEVNKKFNIPYFTVHDSIYISKKFSPEIKLIFEEILDKNNVITGVT